MSDGTINGVSIIDAGMSHNTCYCVFNKDFQYKGQFLVFDFDDNKNFKSGVLVQDLREFLHDLVNFEKTGDGRYTFTKKFSKPNAQIKNCKICGSIHNDERTVLFYKKEWLIYQGCIDTFVDMIEETIEHAEFKTEEML